MVEFTALHIVQFVVLGVSIAGFLIVPAIVGLVSKPRGPLLQAVTPHHKKIYGVDYNRRISFMQRYVTLSTSHFWMHPSLPGHVQNELNATILKRAGVDGRIIAAIVANWVLAFALFIVAFVDFAKSQKDNVEYQSSDGWTYSGFGTKGMDVSAKLRVSIDLSVAIAVVSFVGLFPYVWASIQRAKATMQRTNQQTAYVKYAPFPRGYGAMYFEAFTLEPIPDVPPPMPPLILRPVYPVSENYPGGAFQMQPMQSQSQNYGQAYPEPVTQPLQSDPRPYH